MVKRSRRKLEADMLKAIRTYAPIWMVTLAVDRPVVRFVIAANAEEALAVVAANLGLNSVESLEASEINC
jgi:hypothetical protein